MTGPLLDYEGAAEYLCTTERHMKRLVEERRIPFVKVGRKVRFVQADLDNWITSNRHRSQT